MAYRILIFFHLLVFCFAEPTWTTLRVTWGKNVFSSHNFAKMPLTIGETADKGFSKLPGECNDGKFLGHRYIKNKDPAAILIYDSKGYIAGIQTGIPKHFFNEVNVSYPYSRKPSFQLDRIDDEEIYFLTAYFVNPSTICKSERTEEQFDENIGTGLWFQNGSNPIVDSVNIPLYQKNISDTQWTKGGCFPSMGRHYWYNISEDMNCNDFFPFFLMYNRNKLTGFGFAIVGNFQFTNRYEHPPKNSFKMFLTPVPECLNEEFDIAGGFTTFHIYFTVNPWNLFC